MNPLREAAYHGTMARWEPSVWAFVGVALIWGCGAAVLADLADWSPLAAPASTVVLLGAFGWVRRDRDSIEVIAPALVIAYLAYVGLAMWRLSQPNLLLAEQGTPWPIGYLPDRPLTDYWPVALIGGIPIALILTVFVAVPASMLPLRRSLDAAGAEVDARFAAFFKEWNALHMSAHPVALAQHAGATTVGESGARSRTRSRFARRRRFQPIEQRRKR